MSVINLYGISDLHLSGQPPFKPMTHFGPQYDKYMERIEAGFRSLPAESIVINAGDTSWAVGRDEALLDFKWLNDMGVKIVNTIGNHDYYWGNKGAAFMSGWALDNKLDNIYFIDHQHLFVLGAAVGPTIVAVKGTEILASEGLAADALPNGHRLKPTQVTPRHWEKYRRRLESALALQPDILVSHIPPFMHDGADNELTTMVNASQTKLVLYGHRHYTPATQYDNAAVNGKRWHNLLAERQDFCPRLLGTIDSETGDFVCLP